MSKILLINGSPNEHGCTDAALQEIAYTLKKEDVESEILWLGKMPMQDCIACFKCQETGKCVFGDAVVETTERMDEFDGLVVGSPVYYGGPNGRLTSFLDRFFFSVDKKKIAGKLAASVVSCRRGGASASFERLNQYFLMTNMHVVSSQYWNQVHGYTAVDAKRDLEGMQTMRTLAQNFVYLLNAQQAADASGISKPVYEETIYTNFMD
ncbi:flavodoxin family protein [Lachnospiraceae bacterium TF09-5]|nr:flavodoxin family protein [Lachnospiraceae bacterium TF09-5]